MITHSKTIKYMRVWIKYTVKYVASSKICFAFLNKETEKHLRQKYFFLLMSIYMLHFSGLWRASIENGSGNPVLKSSPSGCSSKDAFSRPGLTYSTDPVWSNPGPVCKTSKGCLDIFPVLYFRLKHWKLLWKTLDGSRIQVLRAISNAFMTFE